ncbi:MAG: VanZ family protein [Anaerolineaceae bacterium]
MTFFGFYLLAVLDAIFFPILIPANWPANLNTTEIVRALQQVNWHPFYFGPSVSSASYPGANMQRIHWFDIIGNILLTIPLGLGIAYFRRMNLKCALWIALTVGLLFEGIQLIVKLILGVYYHAVDINDVIWNALGVLIGFGIFKLGIYISQSVKLQNQ